MYDMHTLQGLTCPTFGKGKSIFNIAFSRDALVPRRVCIHKLPEVQSYFRMFLQFEPPTDYLSIQVRFPLLSQDICPED